MINQSGAVTQEKGAKTMQQLPLWRNKLCKTTITIDVLAEMLLPRRLES